MESAIRRSDVNVTAKSRLRASRTLTFIFSPPLWSRRLSRRRCRNKGFKLVGTIRNTGSCTDIVLQKRSGRHKHINEKTLKKISRDSCYAHERPSDTTNTNSVTEQSNRGVSSREEWMWGVAMIREDEGHENSIGGQQADHGGATKGQAKHFGYTIDVTK